MKASQPRPRGARLAHAALQTVSAAILAAGCHSRASNPQVSAIPAAAVDRSSERAAAARLTEPIPATRNDSVIGIKSADVDRTVVGIFGDTTSSVAPLIDANPTSGPTWDIDVRSYEGQERVAFYVNLFTQSSRSRFQEKLRQGTRYESMIRAKLKAGGIPEDLMYLAMVESGYDPNAFSSAAAVGMWQFMSSTARDVGLRVDWWVDERRDPARSTDAAIRFIRDLQAQFGSLYLAAAAYNGGPGRVSRGLTRFAEEMEGSTGEDRFFALAEHDYLRSETKNYVPQIIAAALVGKEPVRYGFAFDTLAQYVYDSIEVSAGTPLAAVAKASGLSVGAIKELNPAVLRGMVPPTGSLWIRIPLDGSVAAPDVAAALAALSEDERQGYRTMKTTGVESASAIAGKAGITTKQLAWYNPGLKSTKKSKLLAGQSVRIPTQSVVALALNVPDPNIERYGSSTVAATKSGSVHIVKRGESLARIASRYNVTVARLRTLNGLRSDKVVAGQAIRLRSATVARTNSASRTVASRASTSRAASTTTNRKAVAVKNSAARKPPVKAGATRSGSTASSRSATVKPAKTSSGTKVAAKSPTRAPSGAKSLGKRTASRSTSRSKSGA